MEIDAELRDERAGRVVITVSVDITNRFFGVPCHPDFATRVASIEQTTEFLGARIVDAFLRTR